MPLCRKRFAANDASRSEAFEVLSVDVSLSALEIRSKFRMLARKYHTDERCNRFNFTRKEREDMFEFFSNSHNVVVG